MVKSPEAYSHSSAKYYFNDEQGIYRVGVVKRNEKIGNYIGSKGLILEDGTVLTPSSTGADIDQATGGGFNVKLSKTENLTVLVMDSKTIINDYRNKATGKYTPRQVTAGETLAHEMLSHGMTRYNEKNRYNHWVNSVRVSNLYLRVVGINDIFRVGYSPDGHGGVSGNQEQMTKIPVYLKD